MSDPGAVRYGNFKYYYNFNPVEKRMQLVPIDILPKKAPFYALDIGCNSGDLTFKLHDQITKVISKDAHILGIDLDKDLIANANERANDMLQFKEANIMDSDGRKCINNFLEHHCIKKFDVIFCFSVTLWIHLNHGDDGLKEFLQYICSVSDMVIIEPQEWKSYKTANRRLRRNNMEEFATYDMLKMREGVAEEIETHLITKCGASILRKTDKTHWGRTILVLKCS